MNNNKKFITISVLLIVVLIVLSFVWSYFNGIKLRRERGRIEDEVISYLKDKYHENFTVDNFSFERNYYEYDNGEEYVSEFIESSYIYRLSISSARLVKFDVIYVLYEDDDEYYKNISNNVMREGIYENYIYEYKIKEIRKELKEGILNRINNSKNLEVSIDNISLNADNILIDRSLDSEEVQKVYEDYRSLDKTVSNTDFYEMCLKISEDSALIINLNVDKYITRDNIDDLGKEIVDVVSYIQDLGYENYYINLSLDNYQTLNISRYLDNGKEQVFMVFDYENYSDVEEKDKLTVYILDK